MAVEFDFGTATAFDSNCRTDLTSADRSRDGQGGPSYCLRPPKFPQPATKSGRIDETQPDPQEGTAHDNSGR